MDLHDEKEMNPKGSEADIPDEYFLNTQKRL
jgi:hypothetical protein